MKFPFGPTYQEMLNPSLIDERIKKLAHEAKKDELNQYNLFNVSWKDENNKVKKIVLPKELTGVKANIVVLLGKYFPSGSHKIGPAYSILMESFLNGKVDINLDTTLVSPSSGNFGIGGSYLAKLTNLKSLVLMPNNMSKEREELIYKYGSMIKFIYSNEPDFILTLKVAKELKLDKKYCVLEQFETLSNYRFHRYVTGNSLIEACKDVGNGKIACFTAAIGSGGTIAAGDEIKAKYKDAVICAIEPKECPTLSMGISGSHRIQGIGDKMVPLIYNPLSTKYIIQVSDEDSLEGLDLIHNHLDELIKLGISNKTAEKMQNLFGVSGISNIIGAIKMAKHLNLTENDNVVTIATDGFDRYESVLKDFVSDKNFVFRNPFLHLDNSLIFDLDNDNLREKILKLKEENWLKFGYTRTYLEKLKKQDFWDKEYKKIFDIDSKFKHLRNN